MPKVAKQLIKGNEAVVYGSLLGGCTHFFGYPITPASEIAQAAAELFPRTGRHFLQAESEVSVVNMMYGASAAGARTMTASSGPGVSLMAEGLSYLAGAELPSVFIDVQRAGPGLGNIWPEQSDYTMVVKGGGHGNYKNIVLAPNSAQEMCDFTYKAFGLADTYRMTVFILTDAYIGQMMEPVAFPTKVLHSPPKPWAVEGSKETRKNLVSSIRMDRKLMSEHNEALQATYRRVQKEVCEWEEYMTDGADLVYVAYGITSRLARSAVDQLRQRGIKAGLLRLKTLFPFPSPRIRELASEVEWIGVPELSNGQMTEDVLLAVQGICPVVPLLWMGGIVPGVDELVEKTLHSEGKERRIS